jgi:hypothetical protein
MLGFASGVESQVFHGKPLKTDKVSNEELLDSIYAACRTNPTEYAFKVVLDQELANTSMLQIEAIGPFGNPVSNSFAGFEKGGSGPGKSMTMYDIQYAVRCCVTQSGPVPVAKVPRRRIF